MQQEQEGRMTGHTLFGEVEEKRIALEGEVATLLVTIYYPLYVPPGIVDSFTYQVCCCRQTFIGSIWIMVLIISNVGFFF